MTFLISTFAEGFSSLQNGLNDLKSHHHHHHKVDLLEAAGLFYHMTPANRSAPRVLPEGVVLRPGPHSARPAAYFLSSLPDPRRRVKVDLEGQNNILSFLTSHSPSGSPELAMLVSIKQFSGNSGTLLSVSFGSQR